MSDNQGQSQYDVIIVGAGIQGAGVAEAAAEKGLSVLLVERNSEAGLETSSNSSKLIHGGLRYLETLQFSLVYECLSERRWLLKNKPTLVELQPFYIPVYKGSARKPWWVFLGLSFYWLLGGLQGENRFRVVPRSQWSGLGLKPQDLSAVFQYHDAQTNDKKLTQEVISSACSANVQIEYNTEIESAKISQGTYQVLLSNGQAIQCKSIVNTAGPWVNEVAERIELAPKSKFDWVQGSHIVLDVVIDGCFYVESPIDGRAFFVLPWEGKTMVGTTELILTKPEAKITKGEVRYLLQSFNAYFPSLKCSEEQIYKTYSGIRVLPYDSSSKTPNKRSRETLFLKSEESEPLYVAVYGGKLTSYRATARKVIKILDSLDLGGDII